LQRFCAPVWLWDMRIPPHTLHGSMLNPQRCGCGGMYRLFFSAQESNECNEQHKLIDNFSAFLTV
jgi:hypothetical protein